MVGRTDECLDLSDTGNFEWLSEQFGSSVAQIAGSEACSYVNYFDIDFSFRFRAVFRP